MAFRDRLGSLWVACVCLRPSCYVAACQGVNSCPRGPGVADGGAVLLCRHLVRHLRRRFVFVGRSGGSALCPRFPRWRLARFLFIFAVGLLGPRWRANCRTALMSARRIFSGRQRTSTGAERRLVMPNVPRIGGLC